MSEILEVLWHVLRDALLMAWQVWWALVLGAAIFAALFALRAPRARRRTVEESDAGAPAPRNSAVGTG